MCPGHAPLIVHVVHRLGVGGLENGLINLINHMPPDRYRHVIVSVTDSTIFQSRLNRRDISVAELKKLPGNDFGVHRRFWRLLQEVKPDIVHTRNLATLEFQITAALAGVRGRMHGEHGRDIYDLDGTNLKYNVFRKVMRHFVSQYIAVSVDLAMWLARTVHVPVGRIRQIYNGVDTSRFAPGRVSAKTCYPEGFVPVDGFVIGTVGRMEAVKDQITLVRGFLQLVQNNECARRRIRLMVIGDGSLYGPAKEMVLEAGAESLVWFPGERQDVPELMRAMDLFVLPSLREGVSNTILEAMATGLPVVATNVGGNPEIVFPGETGQLVPPSDPTAMEEAIASYCEDSEKTAEQGRKAREVVVERFSMQSMVDSYVSVYDYVLGKGRGTCARSSDVRVIS
jgi:sugar transferase (PEP-CTERM/EpsH1 system associated)